VFTLWQFQPKPVLKIRTSRGPVIYDLPQKAAGVPVIGNKNSKKYHLPGCPSYDSVSEKNRVYFDTEQDAIKAGYTKAGNCNK
jgi:deoxyribonuclease-1